jgi:hypothetical protein
MEFGAGKRPETGRKYLKDLHFRPNPDGAQTISE